MSVTPAPPRIVIVGGGISGLSAAHRLVELSEQSGHRLELRLLEGQPRLGGVIHTVEQDGFLFEAGPENFVTNKPWALALVRRLRIDDQLLPTNEAYRQALVVRRGRLEPVPDGFLLLAPTKPMPFLRSRIFSWPGKLRMAAECLLPPRRGVDDETLAEFVSRRFGHEALTRLVQPLIGGIYTADPRHLSLRSTLPQFLDYEARDGSVIRGMLRAMRRRRRSPGASGARYSLFMSFRRGLRTMIDALAARLPEDTVQCGHTVTSVSRRRLDGRIKWVVETDRGPDFIADGVIIAVSAPWAVELVRRVDVRLARMLGGIAHSSSAVVNLGYRVEQATRPLEAFGFVAPAVERRHLLAGSFSSVKFIHRAPPGRVLVRAFMGGMLQPDVLACDDDELAERARGEMESLAGLYGAPVLTHVERYRSVMPQYAVGHARLIDRMRRRIAEHRCFELAGNMFSGVGIPDCIHAGETAAENVFNSLPARDG